ncbi:MAG: hypothetical protein H5T59_11745 [Anaerolineae bacterium]|nr:hypothetical protein [Anaerolineae bacterium]
MGTAKRVGWALFVVGCAVLGILVAKRVQPDAVALLLGALAGFVVSLPVAMLGFFLLARQARQQANSTQEEEATPPVVIIAPGGQPQGFRGQPGPAEMPGGRQFVVEDWDQGGPPPR